MTKEQFNEMTDSQQWAYMYKLGLDGIDMIEFDEDEQEEETE